MALPDPGMSVEPGRTALVSKPRILVTGATGKTGLPTAKMLLEKGYPVCAMAHRRDDRSERLRSLGAEVVVGDFAKLESIRAAMSGVNRVYFCYPPQGERLLEAATNVAISGRDEGIDALVNMSQVTAREPAKSPLAFQHWQSEHVFDWAGVGAVHINPGFFAEDLYLFTGESIAREGKMYLPFGEGRHAPVAAEDIARVVVGLLEDPIPHVGQRYFITGPKNMKIDEMAAVISRELGKPVEYVDLPIDRWHAILTERSGFPDFLAAHRVAVSQDHQDGSGSGGTDVVKQIGGQSPQSLEHFVRLQKAAFESTREALIEIQE